MRLTFLLFFISFQLFSQESSLLWQVSKEGVKDTSYVFGTIHIAQSELFYVNQKLDSIKRIVDAGYFEILNDKEALKNIAHQSMAKEGEHLKELIERKDYKLVKSLVADESKVMAMMVNKLKPVVVSAIIVNSLLETDTSGAMDMLMQEEMIKNGKRVYGLETPQEQFNILFSASIDKQVEELLVVVHGVDSVRNELENLLKVYKSQDLAAIDSLINLEDSTYLDMDVLNYDRNRKMFPKIEAAMKKESILVSIGAAHLAGEKGIIEMLRQNGYSVIAIK